MDGWRGVGGLDLKACVETLSRNFRLSAPIYLQNPTCNKCITQQKPERHRPSRKVAACLLEISSDMEGSIFILDYSE